MNKFLALVAAVVLAISSVCAIAEQAEMQDDVLLPQTSLTRLA